MRVADINELRVDNLRAIPVRWIFVFNLASMIVVVTRNADVAHRARQLARERGLALVTVPSCTRLRSAVRSIWPALVLCDSATADVDGVLVAIEQAEATESTRTRIAMACGDGYAGTLRELLSWIGARR